ncbi:hypothetical protein [Streptomyces sp. NPDC001678]|uniref:hypothetical protein n=1 Tax=Streptomyces sp. NPDC001678 TaxID=3364599 RepID=UPI0036CFF11E
MREAGPSVYDGLYRTAVRDGLRCELRLDGARAFHRIQDRAGTGADRRTRGEYAVDGTDVRVWLEPVPPPVPAGTVAFGLHRFGRTPVIEMRLTAVLDGAGRQVCRLTTGDGTVYSRVTEARYGRRERGSRRC